MLFHIRQRTDLHVPLPQRERGRGYAQSCQRDFPMVVALDLNCLASSNQIVYFHVEGLVRIARTNM